MAGESKLVPSISSVSTPAPGEVVLDVVVENVIQSDGGVARISALSVGVDGEKVLGEGVTVSPGGSVTKTVEIQSLSAGSHNVCVAISQSTFFPSNPADCVTVSVEGGSSPTPPSSGTGDDSVLTATIDNLTPVASDYSDGGVAVDYTVTNTITSGSGQRESVALEILVDGERGSAPSVVVDPGESVSETNRVDGISAGQHEICVVADGDGDCGVVTVPEPTPDESRAVEDIQSITSPTDDTIVVNWEVDNVIESGDGQRLEPRVLVLLDGSTVDSTTLTLSPGQTGFRTTRIEDVGGGEHEVCVELT